MNIEKKFHNILVLAGTNDQRGKNTIELATRHWRSHGIDVTAYNVGWKDGSKDIAPKLAEIEKLVDELAEKGPVSIIGISAGASAAFNTFLKKPDVIEKVVGVCGRIRGGETEWGANLNSRTFHQSVLLFENQQAQIPDELKKRMMTVSARFGDELVPNGTSHLEGAKNITIPTKMHGLSIILALTLFKKPIIDFIKFTPENSK